MPSPMDLLDGALPARLEGQINASTSGDTSKEGIARKTSYANSVTTKPSSAQPSVCHEREAVLARKTTHNDFSSQDLKLIEFDQISKRQFQVGTPLEMDNVTRGKTRPSMAKVRVKIDLLKPDTIWVGLENEDSPLRGYTQKLEKKAAELKEAEMKSNNSKEDNAPEANTKHMSNDKNGQGD
ncbi:hypothetical protein HAX54_003063 [Datura stramonium]|uniref:Uncharacterized protein n=1 Tax=Datura stramonium TaxID=4076 RepID=A0ABS8T5K5_DATST|nr:hypothetical protein [Datura stramonium]